MLDMFNVHARGSGAGVSVFSQNDPAQVALRAILERLSEVELADVEQDIDYFTRSGVMPERIARILESAEDDLSAVA